ncbi:pyruvoyl-dependent arginine decarboxylase [Salidesulfovibrio onnuriiensis]|uniref:pyruvoyl-dependent arginine decarboxylase n=1 Tax=Salidesulfovibrio onnuriiensis TaxID=2583823 RepID=UPI00202B7084|nr:pyruvoyl-dependent arginine decarboxylase [Salidesulfovibrio onnuriiensis]
MKSRIVTCCMVIGILMIAVCARAQENFGPRIPTAYFAVTGVGQSDDGIPPDPYETFSYDLALLDAGIENFNVVYYTSVLPPESYEVPFEKAKPYIRHGSVLETIMAKAGGVKGDTVATGVGRVWAVDKDGKYIGGFAAEYERIYSGETVDKDKAYADAKAQLTKSLNHELSIRGLKQKGDMTFDITSLQITKNYGIALSALGFVGFIYPEPFPLQK